MCSLPYCFVLKPTFTWALVYQSPRPGLPAPAGMEQIPLLFVEQGEERSPWDVLSDNSELAGVVQAGSHKLDDTWVVQAAEDGNFPAEHVHVRFGAVRVGSVAESSHEGHSKAETAENRGVNASRGVTAQPGGELWWTHRLIATILFLHRPLYTFPKEPKMV